MTMTIDDVDRYILAERAEKIAARAEPGVGDWIIFADNVIRRISHVWDFPATDEEPAIRQVQTSDGGGWYLGDGYVSFSGSLRPSIPTETLTRVESQRTASARVWIFHHDHWGAGRGVDSQIEFPVWQTTKESN